VQLVALIRSVPSSFHDLVEEFRTVIDSLVLYTINRGLLHENDFYYRKDQPGCFLSNDARKRFLQIFETRMWQESRDGYTGKTMSYPEPERSMILTSWYGKTAAHFSANRK
jgi:CRISPR/Cas system-associated endonuclease Cas1